MRHGNELRRFSSAPVASGHVAFGFGPHFCLGAALARAETASAQHLVPHLDGAPSDGDVEWVDSMQFRGRRSLLGTMAPTSMARESSKRETTRVLVEQIGAVDVRSLGKLSGHLSPEELSGVDEALMTVLGLG